MTPLALEFEEQFHGRPVTDSYLKELRELDPSKIKLHAANSGVSEYMRSIGSKGGKIGGKRRLKTMTAEQRKKSAQKAAKARWNNKH